MPQLLALFVLLSVDLFVLARVAGPPGTKADGSIRRKWLPPLLVSVVCSLLITLCVSLLFAHLPV